MSQHPLRPVDSHSTQICDDTCDPESKKNRALALVLTFPLWGWFGAHRFYAGRIKSAVAMLIIGLCCGFPFTLFWAWADALIILFGEFKDSGGRKIRRWK